MPYKSEAQRKYFNVKRKKLEAQGVDVDEWNSASKGKKMPERVKESFVAKLAALSAEEINDMETTSGLLSDFIPTSSSRRSGRARVMAESADSPVPYRINRPNTSTVTDTTLAGTVGGVLGGPAGAAGGAGLGYLLNKLRARQQKQNINEDYEDKRLSGKLKSPTKPGKTLSTLLNPAMRIGEQQAYGAIKADREIPNISKARALLEAGQAPINPASPFLSIPTYAYDAARALSNSDNDLDDLKSSKLSKSGSSIISQLAKQAAYKEAFTPVDLMGAGIGGLAGGIGGYMADPGYDDEGNRRSRFRNALIGGVGGAGMGGAYQYGLNKLRHLASGTTKDISNGVGPEAGSGVGAVAGGIGGLANDVKNQQDRFVADRVLNRYNLTPNTGDYDVSKTIPGLA
jgi:hypothetical protein